MNKIKILSVVFIYICFLSLFSHQAFAEESYDCNYQIYSDRLYICYKKVLTSTADLKYGLYTICTHSDLSECKEFMDKYEQYKTNLHKLKDVTYKI